MMVLLSLMSPTEFGPGWDMSDREKGILNEQHMSVESGRLCFVDWDIF